MKSFASVVTVARLAQSVEHETLNLRVVGSSPTLGEEVLKLVWHQDTDGTMPFVASCDYE